MLTLPTSPELESRIEAEAAKRGLPAPEYAMRLIEGLLQTTAPSSDAEQLRLAAVDELMGCAAESKFSSNALRAEREAERQREEERFRRRFKEAA